MIGQPQPEREPLTREDKEKLDALLAAIDEGDADIAAGRFITINTKEEFDAFLADL